MTKKRLLELLAPYPDDIQVMRTGGGDYCGIVDISIYEATVFVNPNYTKDTYYTPPYECKHGFDQQIDGGFNAIVIEGAETDLELLR